MKLSYAAIVSSLSSYSKTVTLILLGVIGLLLLFMQSATQLPAVLFNLDTSWLLDLGYQLRSGNLLGRDVYFTYGPLMQALVWIGVRAQGSSSMLNGLSIVLLVVNVVSTLSLLLSLSFIRQLRWDGVLLIFLMMLSLNMLGALRQMIMLLAIIVLVYALNNPSLPRRCFTSIAGLFCFICQLISLDIGALTFVCALLILLLCGLLSLWRTWRIQYKLLPTKIYLETLVIYLAVFFILNVVMEIFFHVSSPIYGWFDYLKYNIAIIIGYNYSMGSPWALGDYSWIFFALILYTIGYTLVRIFAESRTTSCDQLHLLLALLIVALLSFKSATVRSDVPHIIVGSTPFLFLFSLMLYLPHERQGWQTLGQSILILVLIGWLVSIGNGLLLFDSLPGIISGKLSVSGKWQEIRAIKVSPDEIIPAGIRTVVDPHSFIINFPYDNVFAIALGQRSLAQVLQTYSAFDEQLQQKYIKEIARYQSNTEIIYGLDGLGVAALDGVQNNTRVPIIFRYVLENFRLKTNQVFNGYMVLALRDQPRPAITIPIDYTSQWSGNGLQVQLSKPANCGLIYTDISIQYPITALFGRPSPLITQVWHSDRKVKENRLVAIERGSVFRTYFYLDRPEKFFQLFSDETSTQSDIAFDHISFVMPEYSLFDVHPTQVTVSGIGCMQMQ